MRSRVVAAGLAVQGIQISLVRGSFRGVALVVDYLAGDDNLVAHLDLGIALNPLLVAEIQDTEGIELRTVGRSVFRNIEGGIAEIGRIILLYVLGNGDAADDTLDIDILVGISISRKRIDVRIGAGRVVRILEGPRTLGFVVFTRGHTAGLAVEGVDIAAALADGLRGIALEIDNLAADNHLVADFYVRTQGGLPLFIAQVVGLVDLERHGILGSVLGDEEIGVAIDPAGLEGHGDAGNDTLDIVRTGFLVGRQSGGRCRGAGRGERILEGTRTFGLLAERAGLADQDGLVVIADVDADGARPVVALVLEDGNRDDRILIADAALRRDVDPVDGRDGLPVAGRGHGHIVRADPGIEAQLGRSDLDLGQPEILFLFPAAGRGERSHRQEGHDEMFDFHFIRNY